MAKKRVNKYPKVSRQMAVERMRNCDNVSALAQELGVDRTVLYHWRNLTPGEAGAMGNLEVRTPDWSESAGAILGHTTPRERRGAAEEK